MNNMDKNTKQAPFRWQQKGLVAFVSAALLLSAYSFTQADNSKEEADDEFSIVVLPDTQYYTSEKNGGKSDMFPAQTAWITKNRVNEKIAYVIQLGDIVETGDKMPVEWERASKAMYALEAPLPGLPHGIPYGVVVGNHDQAKSQFPISGPTAYYNQYFGVSHFQGRPYYGGHYGNDNDSHYDLFSAAGMDFVVIHVEYDSFDEDMENTDNWVCSILEKYATRKAIIASHYIIENNKTAGTNEKGFARYGKQGERLYHRIKRYPNVFMALCGHVGANGEGYRQDFYAGHSIQTFLSDYQSRPNGGDGLMRLMTFSRKKDLIKVKTFSPFTGVEEKDSDSEFTRPWLHGTNSVRQLDYNNDRITELSFFNKGTWQIQGMKPVHFGKEGDIAIPADYNGDGQTDLAVFNAAGNKFSVQGGKEIQFGLTGDIPVPGDYDGDGFADIAVYRPSNNTWYIKDIQEEKFGTKDGIPVPADYDGDGQTDLAIFRTSNALWQIARLGNVPFGKPGDIPVPGDYDGDGRAEMAVYRPTTREWIIDKMKAPIQLGQTGDIPAPGNYLGDGKMHPAVYRNGKLILTDKIIEMPGAGNGNELLNLPYAIRQAFFK
jgi:hypothetical protein